MNTKPIVSRFDLGTLQEGGVIQVQSDMFEISDRESPLKSLLISLGMHHGGQFLLNGIKTHRFTLADVEAGIVSFQHDGKTPEPSLVIHVIDGKHGKTTAAVDVEITMINHAPMVATRALTLSSDKPKKLLSALKIRDEDSELDSLRVDIGSFENLRLGKWINKVFVEQNSDHLRNLKLADLATLMILSEDTRHASSLQLTVSDGQESTLVQVPLRWKATGRDPAHKKPVLEAVNFILAPGESHILSRQDFRVHDDVNFADLTFRSSSINLELRINGRKTKSFTGAEIESGGIEVIFTGRPGAEPVLKITARDAFGAKSARTSADIDFVPSLFASSALKVTEGKDLILSAKSLGLSALSSDLDFEILDISKATIQVNGITRKRFTLLELNAKKVVLRHDGGEEAPSLRLEVTDLSNGLSSIADLPFRLANTNDVPEIIFNAFSVRPGASVTLTLADLRATDADWNTESSTLVFNVIKPVNGHFLLNGQSTTRFTLADIESGAVAFRHSGGSGDASFALKVTDDALASKTTDAISINANHVPSGSLSIMGKLQQGSKLTVSSTLVDEDGLGTLRLVWLDKSGNILGYGGSLTLDQAQVGKQVKVIASYTDGQETHESVHSSFTALIANINDAPTGKLSLMGSAVGNQTLRATSSIADLDGLGSITIYWQVSENGSSGWSDIPGATGSQFTLDKSSYTGKYLRAQARYTDGLATAEVVNSAPSELVTDFAPDRDTRVSSSTGYSHSSTVTALADGGWLLSWMSERDIYQQRFAVSGELIGGETLVNTRTNYLDYINTPKVTALNDGGWLISWQKYYGLNPGIYQQRYDKDGTAIGSESRVNYDTDNYSYSADLSITTMSDGGWLVSWETPRGISFQRYSSEGTSIGDNTLVDTHNFSSSSPSVTTLNDGGWLIAWESRNDIYQQRYAADGTTSGSTRVSTNTSVYNFESAPSVTALNDGGWLVSWTQNKLIDLLNGDNSDGIYFTAQDIYQQRYSADGTTIGSETLVNTTTSFTQDFSSITALNDGGWLVSWTSSAQDGSEYGIYMQRFASDGTPVGLETRVNSSTRFDQLKPDVTALHDGGWIVTWQSENQDGSGRSIHQQRYASDGTPFGGFGPDQAPSGTPLIIGNAAAGATLSAYVGSLLEPDGMGLITWQWQRDGEDIDGATESNYTLQNADVGRQISVLANYIDGYGYATSISSNAVSIQQSLGMLGETLVNTTTSFEQSSPSVTALADGGWLVSWQSSHQDGSGFGIYQQRYASDGSKISNETLVNTSTASDQASPSVTALADGGWLVSWDSNNNIYQQRYGKLVSWKSNNNIYQQRYGKDGMPIGNETLLNSSTSDLIHSPNVTALNDGGWVLTWTNEDLFHTFVYTTGGGHFKIKDIYQQRYASDGSAIGSETLVNTTTDNSQSTPSVTALNDGGWLVTWSNDHREGEGPGVYQQRYASDGTAIGSEIRVNTTDLDYNYGSYNDSAQSPSVTALNDGGWLVTWHLFQNDSSHDVYQQRYASDGSTIGSEIRVNTSTKGSQYFSSVTALNDGGWLVSWSSENQDGSGSGIYQQRYASDGSLQGRETLVNTSTQSEQKYPSVTALAEGGWLISWQSSHQDGSGVGVYQQRYASDGTPYGGFSSDHAPTGSVEIIGNAATGFRLSASIDSLVEADGLGAISWQWQRDGVDIAAATSSSYTLQQADEGHSISVRASYTDGHGYANVLHSNSVSSISLAELAEHRVNTSYIFHESDPCVTALSDGGWLVSWTSSSQNDYPYFRSTFEHRPSDIYTQRYDSDGLAIGNETRVNTSTGYELQEASVTMLSDGGWLVAWTSSARDIYQQRYASDGSAIGSEIHAASRGIPLYYFESVSSSMVTALSDGGWLALWSTSSSLIQQRYASDGSAIGSEIHIPISSRFPFDSHLQDDSPAVTDLSDGGWLVCWTTYSYMPSEEIYNYYDVYQQRYASDGSAIGNATLVNTTTHSNQYKPSVTELNDGAWLVSWTSYDQDGSGSGIYQQRYAKDGSAIGKETRVNTTTIDSQYDPSVTALADGGWLVSWTSDNQDGSGKGIYQQRYSSDGAAIGSETLVNSTTNNDQSSSSVTALNDGGWLVSWQSYNQDGSGWGVYQQRYASDGTPHGAWGENHAPSGTILLLDSSPSNAALAGDTLSIKLDSLLDPDGLGAPSYQWLRDGNDINGATASAYLLTEDDRSHEISAQISYTDGHGYLEILNSNLIMIG